MGVLPYNRDFSARYNLIRIAISAVRRWLNGYRAGFRIRRSFFGGGSNPTRGDDMIGRKMIDNMIEVSKLSQKSENKSQKLRIERSRKKDRK